MSNSQDTMQCTQLSFHEIKEAVTQVQFGDRVNGRKRPSVMITASPGVGKSDLVREIAADRGMEVVDIRLSQVPPEDLRGLPHLVNTMSEEQFAAAVQRAIPHVRAAISEQIAAYMTKSANDTDHQTETMNVVANTASNYVTSNAPKQMKFSRPSFMRDNPETGTLYFFDEIVSAPPVIQAAAYQVILDRQFGDFSLNDNDAVIAAGNKITDGSVVFKMALALVNRFVHYELSPTVDEWVDFATTNKIAPEVIGYAQTVNTVMDFNPKKNGQGQFMSPRSLVFASDTVDFSAFLDSSVQTPRYRINKATLEGAIGIAHATSMIEATKLAGHLPKPQEILEGRNLKLDIKDPAKMISGIWMYMFILCGMLKAAMEERDAHEKDSPEYNKLHDVFIKYVTNYIEFFNVNGDVMGDIVFVAARVVVKNYGIRFQPKEVPAFSPWVQRYGKFINA